jgi:hypothetical protein
LGSNHPLLSSAVWRPPLLDHDHALISVPADGLFGLMQSDIERVLFDGPAIHKRLDEMAAQITADYSDRELTVIAILTDVHVRSAAPNSTFLEIGLPKRSQLPRENANERGRHFQTVGRSRCSRPRRFDSG